jgi:hypothetical protein
MGVVFALYGKHFKLFTDHKALTYMHTQKHANQMMQNWMEELQVYGTSFPTP